MNPSALRIAPILALMLQTAPAASPPKTEAGAATMLAWGIPEKTCTAYGGKYYKESGFSEWETKLVLDATSPTKVAGTLLCASEKLQFSSELDAKSALKSLMIRSGDTHLSITANPKVENEVTINIGTSSGETLYVYRYSNNKVQVIKGAAASVAEAMNNWDALLLFPLLSYKLGAEMKVTGNTYPASLPIHGIALSVAEKKDVQVYKMRPRDGGNGGDRGTVTPVGTSRHGDIAASTATCDGQNPGSYEQECYGQCGPFWFGGCICWPWVCGDCCCHVFCRVHDAACDCGGLGNPDDFVFCYFVGPGDFVFGKINCAPCNDPGNLPCSSGSTCPSGQFYCVYTRSCQPNGSECHPVCEPGKVYCDRLHQCVQKAQCEVHQTCASGYVLIGDECYRMEDAY